MKLLYPSAIALAAALTIPPLVALYFLKLKRMVSIVPSTLLWKRAVEDLRVNAPFQRLRRSLLLLLQLLVLAIAAFTLGQPMLETADPVKDTVIMLIDHSASMNVTEKDGRTRLEKAKELARQRVDQMAPGDRAMVIAFCDRATVVSSFDADVRALKRKIDSIAPTESTTSLAEAMELAEAYAQNLIISGETAGSDIAAAAAPPASLFIYTDGRVADAQKLAVRKFAMEDVRVVRIGERSDNVGITVMQARRQYERPQILEVSATVRNFSSIPHAFDAVLYVAGRTADVKTVQLAPAPTPQLQADAAAAAVAGDHLNGPPVSQGSEGVIVFDEIESAGGGTVEVVLRIEDALSADDRAWAIIEPPRPVSILLVTPGNLFLSRVLQSMPHRVATMTGPQYERAPDSAILEGQRSAFDLVILDRHSTRRLPQGNYFFWGAVPQIEGVASEGTTDDHLILDWNETHPLLRHVAVENVLAGKSLRLKLPPEASTIIAGQSAPVLAYFTRDASQFLLSAFSLIVDTSDGEPMMNTYWPTTVDFVVFMQNAVQYMTGTFGRTASRAVAPGEPLIIRVPERTGRVTIARPDGRRDVVPIGQTPTMHYARTRLTGLYQVEPADPGLDRFAVNLFSEAESQVAPAGSLQFGAAAVETRAESARLNRPFWRHLLIVVLALLVLEWIVYTHRVLV